MSKIKSKRLEKASLTKDEINVLIDEGAVREDFLMIVEGFNAVFDLSEAPSKEVTSFKTESKFDMPVFSLSNDKNRFTLWGSTLLNAYVLEDYNIKTKPLDKANGLPVYFRDEFIKEHTNMQKVSDIRDTKGGVAIYDKYKIIGVVVGRSEIDKERWPVNHKMYEAGAAFLEYEQKKTKNPKLSWLPETRIHEISKCPAEERTFDGSMGPVTLPSFAELKIVGNADTDVRWARGQFVVEKTW